MTVEVGQGCVMNAESNQQPRPKILRRVLGWLKRVGKLLGLLLTIYFLIVLLGLFPVNNDYHPPDDGVEIYVISNEFHADLVLPIVNDVVDWRVCFPASHFAGEVGAAKFVLFGWGDRRFFVETARWRDLKMSIALNALWSNDTALHVTQTDSRHWEPNAVKVRISRDQYAELARYVRATLADIDPATMTVADLNESLLKPVSNPIAGARYGVNDAFYHANGRYHVLNTCNNWVGNGLRRAGVRVGAWTPLPKTIYFYLPNLEQQPPQNGM
ncbi:MAG: TIGR02117 family protein [Planctomycetaceae bacterium]|nr:TIGR02117 family protein [Planctomycetaceae bacterium]